MGSKNLGRKNWRNRIKEYRVVNSAEIGKNPRNFRKHPLGQTKALKGVLEEVGIAGALLAYEHPERGLELIDGHLRQEQGGEWPVLILDVTEAEANILLATHDPLAAMAEQDSQALADLILTLDASTPELTEFLEQMAHETGHIATDGLSPSVDQTELLSDDYNIIIENLTELEQTELLERLSGEGYKCRALIL